MVSEKEFQSIIEYAQKHLQANGFIECCDYKEWKKLNNKKVKEETVYSEEFEIWWCNYPASVKFEYRGRKFTGTRALRDKKEEAWPLYKEATKTYTDEQMLNALKCEIEERKKESYNHKDPDYNALNYMKATTAYLRSGRYSLWIDEKLPIQKEVEEDTTYNWSD